MVNARNAKSISIKVCLFLSNICILCMQICSVRMYLMVSEHHLSFRPFNSLQKLTLYLHKPWKYLLPASKEAQSPSTQIPFHPPPSRPCRIIDSIVIQPCYFGSIQTSYVRIDPNYWVGIDPNFIVWISKTIDLIDQLHIYCCKHKHFWLMLPNNC